MFVLGVQVLFSATTTVHSFEILSGFVFCISKFQLLGKYTSTIYLSAGAIITESINTSFSYFPISPQTSFIFAPGISKLNTLVFATFVR